MTKKKTTAEESLGKTAGPPGNLARRDFVALSVAAGVGMASATSVTAKERTVVETDVEIKTPDGACDSAFFHPSEGSGPAILIWPDAFGLRPSMRAMARRLAAEGYAVLVPNPFAASKASLSLTFASGWRESSFAATAMYSRALIFGARR